MSILSPTRLLRLEGLAVFGIGLALYARLDGGWLLFLLLFLAPDLSMLGYLKDETLGARIYNAGHTYVAPVILGVLGWWSGTGLAVTLSLIWISHIGFDRTLGFGLKHATGFRDTHLGSLS